MPVGSPTPHDRAESGRPPIMNWARRATNDRPLVRHLPGRLPRRSSLTGWGPLRHDRCMSAAHEPDHADDLGMASALRILVVDADDRTRESVAGILGIRHRFDVVGDGRTRRGGDRPRPRTPAAVVVLDPRLPEVSDGMALIRAPPPTRPGRRDPRRRLVARPRAPGPRRRRRRVRAQDLQAGRPVDRDRRCMDAASESPHRAGSARGPAALSDASAAPSPETLSLRPVPPEDGPDPVVDCRCRPPPRPRSPRFPESR